MRPWSPGIDPPPNFLFGPLIPVTSSIVTNFLPYPAIPFGATRLFDHPRHFISNPSPTTDPPLRGSSPLERLAVFSPIGGPVHVDTSLRANELFARRCTSCRRTGMSEEFAENSV